MNNYTQSTVKIFFLIMEVSHLDILTFLIGRGICIWNKNISCTLQVRYHSDDNDFVLHQKPFFCVKLSLLCVRIANLRKKIASRSGVSRCALYKAHTRWISLLKESMSCSFFL